MNVVCCECHKQYEATLYEMGGSPIIECPHCGLKHAIDFIPFEREGEKKELETLELKVNYPDLGGTRILTINPSSPPTAAEDLSGADGGDVANFHASQDFILACNINSGGKDTPACTYKIRWKQSGGEYADVGAATEISWDATDATWSHGDTVLTTDQVCDSQGGDTRQAGERIEGQSASDSIDLPDEYQSELWFGLNCANAVNGVTYVFELWNLAEGATMGDCGSTITIDNPGEEGGYTWGEKDALPGALWSWGNRLDNLGPFSSPVQVGSDTDWQKLWTTPGTLGVIKGEGTLWCGGVNIAGECGLGDTVYRSSPCQVGALTDWDTVKMMTNYSLATKTDNTLWSWGWNFYGQLAQGDTSDRSSPVKVGNLTDWDNIGTGRIHAAAVKTDGTLWTWGQNTDGQLGQEDRTDRSSPTKVGALTDWLNVGGGYDCTYAVKTDGTLWAIGRNDNGQLGVGDETPRSSPTQVGALTDWAGVTSSSGDSVLALKTDGTIWAWGWNSLGQLGLGDTSARSSPVKVGTLTDWAGVFNGADQTTGWTHAIKTDGSLWGWGDNWQGQLGNGEDSNRYSSPIQIGSDTDWYSYYIVGTQGGHTSTTQDLASFLRRETPPLSWNTWKDEDGTAAEVTGDPDWGLLNLADGEWDYGDVRPAWPGKEFTVTKDKYGSGSGSVDVQIKGDMQHFDWGATPKQEGDGDRGMGESGGGAIGISGSFWTWGHRLLVGQNDQSDREVPTRLGALTDWAYISVSSLYVMAVKTDSTLWSWGQNNRGELGHGDQVSRSSPDQVGSLTDWALAVAGGVSCGAIKTDGTLWTWGEGFYGVLGLGDTNDRSSPVKVGNLTDWEFLSVGPHTTSVPCHMLAIKTDGTLWAWGRNIGYFENTGGALGLGDTTSRSSPTKVGALTDWAQTACGSIFSFAIKTDGTLWSWGANDYGQLGHGNITHRSSPIKVGNLTDWAMVFAGYHHAMAIKTDGTLWTWGRNDYGPLGLGDTTYRSSPCQVGALTDWSFGFDRGAGSRLCLASKDNYSTLWTWGQNNYGYQLGLGDSINRSSPTQVGGFPAWEDYSSPITRDWCYVQLRARTTPA